MTSESLQQLTEIAPPTNPFPGLRPFEFHENHLFFGREGQSEQLIAKLSVSRFLAVVGTSGSGKSSLVRAGLLPALFGGLMGKSGSYWRVAIMRPGNDPIGNLARALDAPDVFGTASAMPLPVQHAMTEALLRRGSLGLVEVTRQANLSQGENVLILVDQFEELFRVEQDATRQATDNEKAAFVKLLLEAKGQREVPIYVVLTMRSDYLGDCAQFWDLPEAINESQYLIPRLTREQRREVITGPVAVGGADITPRLINRILNDVGDDPDQLPILQHALMRTWEQWQIEQKPNERLDLPHYEAIGGLTGALSRHANEAYDELSPEQRKLAERLFKCLTEKGADNREVRRPQTIRNLCAVIQANAQAIINVIEVFRQSGRSFLMPPADVELSAESLIDISHESLIRNWQRLKTWVDEEAQSASTYKRLAERAELAQQGNDELLRDPGLQLTLDWQEKNQPNEAWARRYHSGFTAAVTFLQHSKKSRQCKLWQIRIGIGILGVAVLFASWLAWYAKKQSKELLEQKEYAEVQRQIAEAKEKEAKEQKSLAEEREQTSRNLFYVANMNLAYQTFDDGNVLHGQELLNIFLPNANNTSYDQLREFDWYYLWKLNHQEKATLKGHSGSVTAVAFTTDGKTLASGSEDNTVKLWNVQSRQEPTTLKGHSFSVRAVAFTTDGKTLASAGDGTVKLWNVQSGQKLTTLKDHSSSVTAVAFTTDGKTLASGGGDGTVKLWNVQGRQEPTILKGHSGPVMAVAFTTDGKTLASGGGDGTVKLWDVQSRQELTTLKGHSNFVRAVAFTTDGKTLASGGGDGTVKLWDVQSRQELTTLKGHSFSVMGVAFTTDGKTLASGSGDGTVKLYFAATDEEVERQRNR